MSATTAANSTTLPPLHTMDQKPIGSKPEYEYSSSFNAYNMNAPGAVPAVPPSLSPVTPLNSEFPATSSTQEEYYDRRQGPNPPPQSSENYTSPGFSSPTSTASRRSSDQNYDSKSPLAGKPETEAIIIPPIVPPSVQWPTTNFEDWDDLPDILRQDRKADFTPRRPMNVYFIYMRVRRSELALHNPQLQTGELSKILGREWNNMTPDQKAPWAELADRLMRAFKKKFPDYQYERGGSRRNGRRRGGRGVGGAFTVVTPHMMVENAARRSSVPSYQLAHPRSMPYPDPQSHQHQQFGYRDFANPAQYPMHQGGLAPLTAVPLHYAQGQWAPMEAAPHHEYAHPPPPPPHAAQQYYAQPSEGPSSYASAYPPQQPQYSHAPHPPPSHQSQPAMYSQPQQSEGGGWDEYIVQ